MYLSTAPSLVSVRREERDKMKNIQNSNVSDLTVPSVSVIIMFGL